MRPVLAALSALALIAAAPAPPAEVPPKFVHGVDNQAYWAIPGLENGGRAIMRCKVSAKGELSGCDVLKETPPGSGAGRAMVGFASRFKVEPATRDGVPVASEMVVADSWWPRDTGADWIRQPTSADIMAVFPTEAFRQGIGGRALISCLVGLQGSLYDCAVLSEEPAGIGFGMAALALSPQFQMRPATRGGRPVVSTVNIPIRFSDPGSPNRAAGRGMTRVVSPASVWLQAPTFADVAAVYPKAAKAARTGGRATVACPFLGDGHVGRCRIVAETPAGRGFGSAAQTLARQFYAKAPEGGTLKDAMVQLPVTFDPGLLDTDSPPVGKPQWAAVPDGAQMKAALAGLPKGVGTVRVMLICTVEQLGRLSACAVESETPAGKGFGQAALGLTPRFQLTTWSQEGLPVVGGRVRLPLRFETDEPAAP